MRGSLAATPQWPIAALLTMSAAVFLSVATELLPTGLLPAMSRDLSVTPGQLGLLVTSYALMVLLFAAPLGMLVTRVPRRRLMLAALLAYGACNAITAVSDSFALTIAGRMVGGLTHAVFWGMVGGYASRIVAPDRVGRAVTIVSVGGPAAVLLGVPAGTALGVAIGWRAAFLVFTAASVLLALVSVRLLPAVPGRSRDTPAARLRDVIRLPGMAAIVTITALTMLGHFSFFTYIAPFLLDAGLSEAAIGPALLACGAAGIVGLLATGVVVDRRPRAAMVISSASLTVAFGVLTVGGWLDGALTAGGATALAVVGSASTGFALGSLPVFLQAATLRAAPAAPDQASALNASAFNVGIAGGAFLGGLTLDRWGAGALPVVACVLTGVGLLAMVLGRQVGVPATV